MATGLRNPFGLVFDGDTLYASVNARDDLGKNEPAETIVRIKPGADYGWPRLLGELAAPEARRARAAA